jgi:hypothetical protein
LINPLQYRSSSFARLAEGVLQDAIPTKVLLWRKVGNLQALQVAIERCISEVLQICRHWNTNYGEYVRNYVAEHPNLSFKIQSWYVILVGHWQLAYLQVACCIEQIHERKLSESLQQTLQRSSVVVLELPKESVYSIAGLARAFCENGVIDDQDVSSGKFHDAVYYRALLTEPWTNVLSEALSIVSQTFLG